MASLRAPDPDPEYLANERDREEEYRREIEDFDDGATVDRTMDNPGVEQIEDADFDSESTYEAE